MKLKLLFTLFLLGFLFFSHTSYSQDTDLDGVINNLDIDDDNDGIPDSIEQCGSPAILDWTETEIWNNPSNIVASLAGNPVTINTEVISSPTADAWFGGDSHDYSGSVSADAGASLNGNVQLSLYQDDPSGTQTKVTFNITPHNFGVLNLFISDAEIIAFVVYAEDASTNRLSTANWDITSYEQNGTTPASDPNPYTVNTTDISFIPPPSIIQNDDAMRVRFDTQTLSIATKIVVETTKIVGNTGDTVEFMLTTTCPNNDTDNDGTPDYLDIDADNDGIPDNIEGQPTTTYNAPSGTVNTTGASIGLWDNYGTGIITPENTDGVDQPDYLDLDTDNDGTPDIQENGDVSTLSNNDGDTDGLDDNFDAITTVWDVNDEVTTGNITDLTTSFGDADGDVSLGGDLDYRDDADSCTDASGTDSDNDGINDLCDLDDDNDGIPDTDELGTIISTDQQPCGGDTPLDFSGTQTLLSGTDLLQGAKYRFSNITATMDAIVTIVETNNATVATLDRNVTTPESFKPQTGFNFTNAGEFGYIEYLIEFVNTGGTTPQIIDKFFMNFNDLDGGPNYGEQNWADNPKTYTIDNPTEVTMNTDGTWIVATGAAVDYPPSTNELPKVNFAVNYTNKSEISIRVGAVARVPGASATARSHSIEFNCVTNYVSPDTYALDIDYDGLANHLDLDSDNDGILDAVEAGHNQAHTNGVVNGTYGTNGLPDSVETSPGSGTINYMLTDTDGIDGSNYLDIDSDNDYCYDALEGTAGYAYSDIDVLNGQLLSSIDANGIPGGMSQEIGTSTDINVQADACISNSATLDFDGEDDYVKGTSVMASFNQSNTDGVTLMGWIKSDSDPLDTNQKFVFGERNSVELYITDEDIRAYIHCLASDNTTTTHDVYRSTTGIVRNVWRHVTIIVSFIDNKATLLLDGDFVFSTNLNDAVGFESSITEASEEFMLGNNPLLSSTRFFKGAIDEVRIVNKVMLEDEVKEIVFQEIENNSGLIGGSIIHNSLSNHNWSDLQLYYPMTNIINGFIIDESNNDNIAKLFNITSFQEQTAPMPYTTKQNGNWHDKSTWEHGDVWYIPGDEVIQASTFGNDEVLSWGIYHIKNDVTLTTSMSITAFPGAIQGIEALGVIIDEKDSSDVDISFEIGNGTTDLQLKVNKYLELNGTLNLQGDSQLVQGINSDLVTSATGKILRRQEGNTNKYWYNYWSSPVGSLAAKTLSDNNTEFNNTKNTPFILDMLKDGNENPLTFDPYWNNMVEGVTSSYWLYTFQNGITYNDWVSIDEASPIQPGFGYTQKGTGNTVDTEQQYIFEGKPNNGTILIEANDVEGDDGETTESVQDVSLTTTFIGNPYPSALNAIQFIDDNKPLTGSGVISGTIQLWEQWAGSSHYLAEYEGGYGYINNSATERAYQHADIPLVVDGQGIKVPTNFLPVGQGFFVEVIKDGNIEFNNGQRVFKKENTGESVFYRSSNTESESTTETTVSETQILRLEFGVSSGASRSFVLGFNEDATDGLDYGMDGGMISDPPADDMGSLLNGFQYVIQTFAPITYDKEIDLVLHASGNFTYTLRSTEITNIPEDQDLFLRDNLTGTYYDLRSEQVYNFTSEAGDFAERFDVIFLSEDSLSNEEFTNDNTIIFVNNTEDMLYVKGLSEQAKQLSITNMLGQAIKTYTNVNNQTLENGINISNLSSGVYVVSIQTDNNQTIDKKVIIN